MAHPAYSLNTTETRFLSGMPSPMFPCQTSASPSIPWIQLRPNDTSAAIITYSPIADRRKRVESVLSIYTPPPPLPPQSGTTSNTRPLLACLPSTSVLRLLRLCPEETEECGCIEMHVFAYGISVIMFNWQHLSNIMLCYGQNRTVTIIHGNSSMSVCEKTKHVSSVPSRTFLIGLMITWFWPCWKHLLNLNSHTPWGCS